MVALALMVAGMGTVMSSFFFLTTYLQAGLGHSALRTGLEFLPGAIVLVIAAHLGQQLVARHGAKPVLAGGMTLGAGGALLLSGLPADGSYLARRAARPAAARRRDRPRRRRASSSPGWRASATPRPGWCRG